MRPVPVLATACAAALAAVALTLPGAAPAATPGAGDLDPAFALFTASPAAAAVDVAATADGGAVVLTASWRVVRLRPNGTLDPEFGEGGVADVAFDTGSPGPAAAIAVDDTGRIVVGGEHDTQAVLARLLPDGDDDASFGTGGRTVAAFGPGGSRIVTRIRFDAGGRIVALGRRGGPGSSDVVVVRLSAGGAPDPTFGTNGPQGRHVIDIGLEDEPGGVAIDELGRIVVSGWRSGSVGFTMRLTEMGWPDPSYVAGGWRDYVFADATATRLRDLAILPDGRIAVAGEAQLDDQAGVDGMLLVLDGEHGTLDGSFGDGVGGASNGDGRRFFRSDGEDALHRVLALPDGHLVVANRRSDGADARVSLTRVTSGGFDASSFGTVRLPGVTAAGGLALDSRGVLFSGAGAGGVDVVAGRVLLDDAEPQPDTQQGGGSTGGSAGGQSSDPSSDPFPSEDPPIPPVGGHGGGVIVTPQTPSPPRAVAVFDDRLRERRSGYRITGTARGENGVRRVEVAILRRDGSDCRRVLDRALSWSAPGSCARRTWIAVSGTTSWSLTFGRRALQPGSYRLYVRAVDRSGPGAVQRAGLEVVRRTGGPWRLETTRR